MIFWSMCSNYPSNVSSLRQAAWHEVWVTPYSVNLIAVEQLKPLIRAVGVCPGVSVHWPQMPESYQAAPAAQLHPGQGTGTGSKAGHMAVSVWAFGNWGCQCTCTLQVLFRNFIVQFLTLAVRGWDAVRTTRCRVLWPLYFLQSWEDQINKWQIK